MHITYFATNFVAKACGYQAKNEKNGVAGGRMRNAAWEAMADQLQAHRKERVAILERFDPEVEGISTWMLWL